MSLFDLATDNRAEQPRGPPFSYHYRKALGIKDPPDVEVWVMRYKLGRLDRLKTSNGMKRRFRIKK